RRPPVPSRHATYVSVGFSALASIEADVGDQSRRFILSFCFHHTLDNITIRFVCHPRRCSDRSTIGPWVSASSSSRCRRPPLVTNFVWLDEYLDPSFGCGLFC
ncbi:unnamed protein product, partial [Citrullus colocynthis]